MRGWSIIIVVIGLVLAPVAGSAARTDGDISAAEERDQGNVQVSQTASSTLPPGAWGLEATVHWPSGTLTITPLLEAPMPEKAPLLEEGNGCLLTGEPDEEGARYGWTVQGLGIGNTTSGCEHEVHHDGVHTQSLVCAEVPSCEVLAIDNLAQGAWLRCSVTGAMVGAHDWGADATLTVGSGSCTATWWCWFICTSPPAFEVYDARVIGQGPGLVAGLVNSELPG